MRLKAVNWLIKKLVIFKLKHYPEWLGTSIGVDDVTDIHILVETWRDGHHYYGTKID